MNKTIEIPADVMEAAVADVNQGAFLYLVDAEIIRELLTAGTNKAQQ